MLFAVRFHDRPDRLEIRRAQLEAHIQWVDSHKDVLLVAGSLRHAPDEAPVGGLWIVTLPGKEQVEALIATDPFAVHGLRESYEILHWSKALPAHKALV